MLDGRLRVSNVTLLMTPELTRLLFQESYEDCCHHFNSISLHQETDFIMNHQTNLLDFPDEILKHIILFLGFWDKNSLRGVCKRFYDLVVNDVRKIIITKDWVTTLQKSRRILKSAKYPAAERRERKERIVILYITRHRNLKCLHFYQSGLCLIHRTREWKKYFINRLAKKCQHIEELLVQGTTGLTIAAHYVKRLVEHHRCESSLKSIHVDPYNAGDVLCLQLAKLTQSCPSLVKVTFISPNNDTDLSKGLHSAKKMLTQLNGQVKYFATDFSGDYDFKLLVINELHDLEGLTLCRHIESTNNFPMLPHHMTMINEKNPYLKRLRIPLSNESLNHLNLFQNLTHLSLIVSCHLTRSLSTEIFTAIGSRLNLLSLTFTVSSTSHCDVFTVNLNFSLISNLNIFSLHGQHNLQFDELLTQLGANCRLLTEIYFSSPQQDIDVSKAVDNVSNLCPHLQVACIQNAKYKGNHGSLCLRDGDAKISLQQAEQRFFY